MKCAVAALICLAAGCTLRGSDARDRASVSPPRATRIVYSDSSRNGELDVWIARVDGTRKRRLANGHTPVISPDGRWVVFQGGRGSEFEPGYYRDLMLVSTSGGTPRLLARAADRPRWSPDSRRVAAIQHLDDRRRALLMIDAETGASTTVARGAIEFPTFSPHGDEIAYTRGTVFGKIDIYRSDADGSAERRVTDTGDSAFPVWGPRELAFARIVPYRGWGAHEVWLVRPDGSGRRLLTKTPPVLLGQGITGLVPVAWSADGDALLAELTNEFGGIPFAVNPRTGSVRRIGDYGYHASADGLSRDGRFVLVSQTSVGLPDRSRIDVIGYSGGRPRLIARASSASWNR